MHMTLVARAFERIGDNAVDIGEQIAFVVTGLFREFSDSSVRAEPSHGSGSENPANERVNEPVTRGVLSVRVRRRMRTKLHASTMSERDRRDGAPPARRRRSTATPGSSRC